MRQFGGSHHKLSPSHSVDCILDMKKKCGETVVEFIKYEALYYM